MIQLTVVGLGVLVMLVAMAGFLRGLWRPKPRGGSPSSWFDGASPTPGDDYTGHSGDAGHGGH
jgi:hypothetical protein